MFLEENQKLKKITEECKIMLADSDREMENAIDNRLLILKDRLDQERSHRQKLQKEVGGLTVSRILISQS